MRERRQERPSPRALGVVGQKTHPAEQWGWDLLRKSPISAPPFPVSSKVSKTCSMLQSYREGYLKRSKQELAGRLSSSPLAEGRRALTSEARPVRVSNQPSDLPLLALPSVKQGKIIRWSLPPPALDKCEVTLALQGWAIRELTLHTFPHQGSCNLTALLHSPTEQNGTGILSWGRRRQNLQGGRD